jgi:hypothetical protein
MAKGWIVAAAMAGLCVFTAPAQASTISMTGGDPGEGYAALSSTFGALDLGGVGGFVVQGVNFTASDPHIALSPVLAGQAVFFDLGDTPNDNSLDSILFTVVFQQPGPITVTVTGLTVGTSYQFDYFLGLIGGNRTVQFSAAGITTIVDTAVLSGDGAALDVRQLIAPDAAGQVTVTVSAIAGFPSPIMSALSITSDQATPIPEPASFLLLGTAFAGVMLRHRSC